MSPVFLDADVILDVLAERHPFYTPAARLMTLIEAQETAGYTSSLIFANLYYILRRLRDRETALASLRRLHTLLGILPVDDRCIAFALDSPFVDFEDAIQYYTAFQHEIGYLVTRNVKDYRQADDSAVTVCTAEDYLGLWLVSRSL